MGELLRLAYETAAKDAAWSILPILMADMETGDIVYVSQSVADIFGYHYEELIGKKVEILVPEDLRDAHSRWRKDTAVPKTRLMGVGRALWGVKKDGATFPVHIGLTAVHVHEHMIGIAFIIDLTGIVQAEQNRLAAIEVKL